MKKIILAGIVFTLFSVGIYGQTGGVLSVKVTTVSGTATSTAQTRVDPRGSGRGGNRSYAPQNIMAIWIEDSNGKFVKTLLVNSRRYTDYLSSWKTVTSAAGSTFNAVDAVTGATNMDHGVRTCTWDGTDINGKIVADGSYFVKMELTETNSTGNSVSFPFTKGKSSFSVDPGSSANFTDVSLTWEPDVSSID